MKKTINWVLDYGSDSVLVLAALEKKIGDWEILGRGQARSAGIKGNEIQKTTDVVESIVEAVRKAEHSAQAVCRALYYNIDDCQITSVKPRGVKTLLGEGQIRKEDVDEAKASAMRLILNFETKPVYSSPINFMIDSKDVVVNPVGVFGNRLEVTLHALVARSLFLDKWTRIMQRSGIEKAIPVLSFLSSFSAVLPKARGTRIVWDLGCDVCSGGVVEDGCLKEFDIFVTDSLCKENLPDKIQERSRFWAGQYKIQSPCLLTGDLAGKLEVDFDSEIGVPAGFSFLEQPQYAAILGLLRYSSESQKNGYGFQSNWHLIQVVKQKASSVLQEYF